MSRSKKNVLRLFGGACLLGFAAFSFGQVVPYHYSNPYIVVPKSSRIEYTPHMRFTHYLVNNQPRSASEVFRGIFGSSPRQQANPSNGFMPADIQAAYNVPVDNSTQAIAIVDAFDIPTALSDFNTFSSTFGLPQETSTNVTSMSNKVFTVVYANGSQPAPDQGWAGEEALDIEWAHAMAPHAKIYLVEAASNADPDLFSAESLAATLPNVKEVSNSWGGLEDPSESSLDSYFVHKGVIFFASAGDFGGVQQYPSESPNVIAVGGTSLFMSGGKYLTETAWSDSGGGPSAFEPRPDYQAPIQSIVNNVRGCPDIAAVADPNTGVDVYSQYAAGGWFVVGGTSVACPVCAGITNSRGTLTSSSHRELQRIYFNYKGPYYRDVVGGSAGNFTSVKGWDYITGIGTPNGGFPPTSPPFFAAPLRAATVEGKLVSGSPAVLATADTISYVLGSTLTREGQASAMEIDLQKEQTQAPPISTQVTLVSQAPLGTTIQVFEKNWITGNYDYVRAFPAKGMYSTVTLPVPTDQYLSPNGSLDWILQSVQPLTRGRLPYNLYLDQVQLSETFSQAWDINSPP